MTNEEMLEKLRIDRPNQIIHEVKSFKEVSYGYEVDVLMEATIFLETTKYCKMTLPYPLVNYLEFTEKNYVSK